MSSGWFDVEALQSSIMDSVGEASKMMDELNLDNMQGDSGISTESGAVNNTTEEVTHSKSDLEIDNAEDKDNMNSFYRQDLNSVLKDDPHGHETNSSTDHTDTSSGSDPYTHTSPATVSPAPVKTKPVIEMEEVTEFTEFGVPITIMQPKAVVIRPQTPPPAPPESEGHRAMGDDEDNNNNNNNNNDNDNDNEDSDEEEEEEGVESARIFSIWNLDSLQDPEERRKTVVPVPVTHSDESESESDHSHLLHNTPQHSSNNSNNNNNTNTPHSRNRDPTSPSSSLPQYVDQSLLSDYLYPINNLLFSKSILESEGGEEGLSGTTTNEEDEESLLMNDSSDNNKSAATITSTTPTSTSNTNTDTNAASISEATTSFFGAATSTLLLNAKANIPDTLFSRPSFFDDDDSDEDDCNNTGTDAAALFRKNDPIYQRVEQNKINPPQPRSSQQSIFQSGSAFFSSAAPSTNADALQLTPAEVRRQSRAYGVVSKVITCVMWLIRLLWNILSTICGLLASVLRSMFDCPASSGSAALPTTVANNFCEAMQHPVTRAQLVSEYRVYLFNIIVSNNFIAVMTTLLLAASYWKFRRYGTDSGD